MRTLRLFLTGTVILALLGGLGGAVLAQMDAPDAVYVTGTGPPSEVDVGTVSWEDDIYHSRDGVAVSEIEASDPRASGTMTVFFNADVDPTTGHGLQWGTLRIENAGGTWEGPYTGMEYEPPEGDFIAGSGALVGDGDYAGYVYYQQFEVIQFGPGEHHGVIYKGQPPWPEAPAE